METSSEPVVRDRSRVQSLRRAFELLGFLERANRTLTATELSQLSGIDRTVTHRLLLGLRDEGLVETAGSGYTVGARSLTLSSSYLQQSLVQRAALPYLIDFLERAVSGRPWVVMLLLPARNRVVIVDRIWGANAPLNAILGIGSALEYEHSAGGRSMLAALPPAEVEHRLGHPPDDVLLAALEEIRSNDGIELTDGDFAGIRGIATAVVNSAGEVVCAISVSGHDLGDEFNPRSALARQLQSAARTIGNLA